MGDFIKIITYICLAYFEHVHPLRWGGLLIATAQGFAVLVHRHELHRGGVLGELGL
jgi:hypothetical protein